MLKTHLLLLDMSLICYIYCYSFFSGYRNVSLRLRNTSFPNVSTCAIPLPFGGFFEKRGATWMLTRAFLYSLLQLALMYVQYSLVLHARLKPYLRISVTIVSHAVAMRHNALISWYISSTFASIWRDKIATAVQLMYYAICIGN